MIEPVATIGRGTVLYVCLAVLVWLCGCGQRSVAFSGTTAYLNHDYPGARDAFRPCALGTQFGASPNALRCPKAKENIVLNQVRLGLASLADGDLIEAERALLEAKAIIESGGVNPAGRVAAATIIQEDIRIWKGEPYEQAMVWYAIGALYMVKGDWENGRAAAHNALFKLRDFGNLNDKSTREIHGMIAAAKAAERDEQPTSQATAPYQTVESEFALGYLMAGTNNVLMGRGQAGKAMFDQVRKLKPVLAPLADALEQGQYDTLLLIDFGRGPSKVSHGKDDELIRFVPDGRERKPPLVQVLVDGESVQVPTGLPVVDLWKLSQYPRWWSLESVRRAKSDVGSGLMFAGGAAVVLGDQVRSREAQLAGLGAIIAGALLKASSRADTRHLAILPRCVFIVPLSLGQDRRDVTIRFQHGLDPRTQTQRSEATVATWHMLRGGTVGHPQVYYLRMHDGAGKGMPRWTHHVVYPNTDIGGPTGDLPYILGGKGLSQPSEQMLLACQKRGRLTDMTLTQLQDLYRREGIFVLPGPQGFQDKRALNRKKYRHLVDGGRVLWTPRPGTHAFERIFFTNHRPYRPRSQALRQAIDQQQKRSSKESVME